MNTPEYDFELVKFYKNGAKDKIIKQDTLMRIQTHTLRYGFEGKAHGVKFFDEILGRAGLVYKLQKTRAIRIDTNGNEIIISNPVVSTSADKFYGNKGMKVSAGLGFTKKRATIDISADLLNWKSGSVLTGPAAALITLTIDMASMARSGATTKEPEPEPEQTPEPPKPTKEPPKPAETDPFK
jgi:hypothetical protein